MIEVSGVRSSCDTVDTSADLRLVGLAQRRIAARCCESTWFCTRLCASSAATCCTSPSSAWVHSRGPDVGRRSHSRPNASCPHRSPRSPTHGPRGPAARRPDAGRRASARRSWSAMPMTTAAVPQPVGQPAQAVSSSSHRPRSASSSTAPPRIQRSVTGGTRASSKVHSVTRSSVEHAAQPGDQGAGDRVRVLPDPDGRGQLADLARAAGRRRVAPASTRRRSTARLLTAAASCTHLDRAELFVGARAQIAALQPAHDCREGVERTRHRCGGPEGEEAADASSQQRAADDDRSTTVRQLLGVALQLPARRVERRPDRGVRARGTASKRNLRRRRLGHLARRALADAARGTAHGGEPASAPRRAPGRSRRRASGRRPSASRCASSRCWAAPGGSRGPVRLEVGRAAGERVAADRRSRRRACR